MTSIWKSTLVQGGRSRRSELCDEPGATKRGYTWFMLVKPLPLLLLSMAWLRANRWH